MAENDNLQGNENEQVNELVSNNEIIQDVETVQKSELAEESKQQNDLSEEAAAYTINADQEASPVKKKINSKIIAFIAAAVVVIGVAGVLFAKFAVPVLMPKIYIAGAAASTQKELGAEAKKIQEVMGVDLQEDIMQSEAMQNSFAVTIEDMSGEGTEYAAGIMRGMGISTEAKRNKENTLATGKIALNQNSLSLLEANFYKKDSEIGVSIPKLFDQYLAVNLDTFVKDYNASALCKMMGQTLDEENYNAVKKYLDNKSNPEVNKELVRKMSERAKQLSDKIDVKYTGKTDVKIAEQNKKFNSYEITVPEAEMKGYLKDTAKILMEDKGFQDYLKTLDVMEQAQGQEKTSDMMKKAVDEFNAGIDKAEQLSLKVKLVIDNNSHIVKFVYLFTGKIDGKNTEIQADASLLGSKFMLDDAKFTLSLKSDNEKAGIDLASTSNYGNEDAKIKQNVAVEMKTNEVTDLNMKLDIAYDTKAKENNLSIKADINSPEGTQLTADASGTMNIDRAKKLIDTEMKKIALKVTENGAETGITLTGKYSLKAIKASDIQIKKDNAKQLFSMTEEEINQLIQGAYNGAMQVGSALFQ